MFPLGCAIKIIESLFWNFSTVAPANKIDLRKNKSFWKHQPRSEFTLAKFTVFHLRKCRFLQLLYINYVQLHQETKCRRLEMTQDRLCPNKLRCFQNPALPTVLPRWQHKIRRWVVSQLIDNLLNVVHVLEGRTYHVDGHCRTCHQVAQGIWQLLFLRTYWWVAIFMSVLL